MLLLCSAGGGHHYILTHAHAHPTDVLLQQCSNGSLVDNTHMLGFWVGVVEEVKGGGVWTDDM